MPLARVELHSEHSEKLYHSLDKSHLPTGDCIAKHLTAAEVVGFRLHRLDVPSKRDLSLCRDQAKAAGYFFHRMPQPY
jgi:hypothetical protein